jgi:serine/threonine protein kinase
MPLDRAGRVQQIVRQALAGALDQRDHIVDRACGPDKELRRDVHALLHKLGGQDTSPPVPFEASTASLSPPDSVGEPPPSSFYDGCDLAKIQAAIGRRYALQSRAGAGGMGTVFIAHDSVLNRKVAIKLLHAFGGPGSSEGENRRRLIAEARTMAGLNHPNICRIFEISLDSNIPFIVMDWVDGIHLHEAWRGMEVRVRLELFIKIVSAVAAAHASGIIHRDLKPTNILVDRRGEPVIVDFGLAKSDAFTHDQRHTRGGTPGYASPEQFVVAGQVGPHSDVYSLGVLLFQLMTDRLPFRAQTVDEWKRMVSEQAPPLPESIAPGLPWPLQRICLAALETDASNRYPDAQQMAADLARYIRGETVAARPTTIARQFSDQVEQHIADAHLWKKQQLITETESNRLQRLLMQMLRPETHWILDSRILSVSQVTLYLGAWLVLLALSVGLQRGWNALDGVPWLRVGMGATIAIIMVGTGLRLHHRGEKRVSLGFLVTACLSVPIALWLVFRETGWLEAGASAGDELFGEIADDLDGLHNAQVLVNAALWVIVSLALRWRIGSSVFTPFLVMAAGLIAASSWSTAGWLDYSDHVSLAKFGSWWLVIGLATFVLGLSLNRREEWHQKEFGQLRARPHDSWVVLAAALLAIIAGLSLMAWHQPQWYWLGLRQSFDVDGEPDITTRAAAFMVNGVALQALMFVLERSRTLVRSRLAELLRWITPQHFLAAIIFLIHDALETWSDSKPIESTVAIWLWLIALYIVSLIFCYLSVRRQWRPFMITGVLYLGVAFWTMFTVFEEIARRRYPESAAPLHSAQLTAILLTLGLGLIVMIIARNLPPAVQSPVANIFPASRRK